MAQPGGTGSSTGATHEAGDYSGGVDERLRELERRFREGGREDDRRALQAARARAGVAPAVGLVFLDDLQAFAPWSSDRAPGWRAERGLDGPLLPPTAHPPLVVVAVARSAVHLESSAPWLQLAARVVVVALPEAEAARDALPGSEWFVAARELDLDARTDEALAHAAAEAEGAWTWLARSGEPTPAAAPGPWVEVTRPADPAALAPRLCARGARPALYEPGTGTLLDLLTGERAPVGGPWATDDRPVVAVEPSGRAWFWSPDGRGTFHRAEEGDPPEVIDGRWGGQAIGVDPAGRVAWAGYRTTFHWWVPAGRKLAFWTPSPHEWPCGHAKKLYGFQDNDPCWVHLAPDASACLSVYEHDVLLTPGLPLRWRDVGAHAVAERARGEPRALLFQRGDEPDAYPADPLEAEEDARDRRATVVLGPSAEVRYAVGLEATTYRLAGGEVRRLGGPADAWVVFDDAHREVQRHRGRLLAGWDRAVVVLRDAALHRVDLLTGDDEDLGPPGRAIVEALAVPGTRNVLLVSEDAVRLV